MKFILFMIMGSYSIMAATTISAGSIEDYKVSNLPQKSVKSNTATSSVVSGADVVYIARQGAQVPPNDNCQVITADSCTLHAGIDYLIKPSTDCSGEVVVLEDGLSHRVVGIQDNSGVDHTDACPYSIPGSNLGHRLGGALNGCNLISTPLLNCGNFPSHPNPPPPLPPGVNPTEVEMQRQLSIINGSVEAIIGLDSERRIRNNVIISVGDITVPILRDPPLLLSKESGDYIDLVDGLCDQGLIEFDAELGICDLVDVIKSTVNEYNIESHVEDILNAGFFPDSCPIDYRVSNPYDESPDNIRFFVPAMGEDNLCSFVELDIFDQVKKVNGFSGENHSYNTNNYICLTEEGNCTDEFIGNMRMDIKMFQAPFLPPLSGVDIDLYKDTCGVPPYRPLGGIIHRGNNECLGPLPLPNAIIFRVGESETTRPPLASIDNCIINETRPEHIFYLGYVDRCHYSTSLGVRMDSEGSGIGPLPTINEHSGALLFNGLDKIMRAYYCSRPGVSCTLEGWFSQ